MTDFIRRSYESGLRLVLVITGKGTRGNNNDDDAWWESGPGILKQRVPGWLDDAPLRTMVLQYHAAQPRDGGDGALYVLLRRRR